MASINFSGLDKLMEALEAEAERLDRNGDAAVMAGAKVAVQAMERTVPVRTGGLQEHIKAKKLPYSTADGHRADVYPTGKDPRGERYETIGFVLEHGRSDMPAQPWMRTAMESESEAIAEAMANELMKD